MGDFIMKVCSKRSQTIYCSVSAAERKNDAAFSAKDARLCEMIHVRYRTQQPMEGTGMFGKAFSRLHLA